MTVLRGLIFCLSVAVLAACDQHRAPGGGVGVGNGSTGAVSHYVSPYKFRVRYPGGQLALVPGATFEKFELTDGPIPGRPEEASRIEFRVIAAGESLVKSEGELLEMAKRLHGGDRVVVAEKLPGTKAVVACSPASAASSRRRGQVYYLLTQNDDLVTVRIDAFSSGDRFALLSSVLESFVHDLVGPTVTVFSPREQRVAAGGLAYLRIDAGDDYSGIGSNVQLVLRPASRVPGVADNARLSLFAELRQAGRSGYEIVAPLREDLAPGRYCVTSLTIWDGVRNLTTLVEDGGAGLPPEEGACGGRYRGSSIDVVELVVESPLASDTRSPRVESVRFDTQSIPAGSYVRLVLGITEEESGIKHAVIGLRPLFGLSAGRAAPAYEWILSTDVKEEQTGISRLNRESEREWSAKLPFSIFRLAGQYRLEGLQVVDRAFNRTVLLADSEGRSYLEGGAQYVDGERRPLVPPVLSVKPARGAKPDTLPPEVEQLLVTPLGMDPGAGLGLWLRVKDDASGALTVAGKLSRLDGPATAEALEIGLGRALVPVALGPDLFYVPLDSPKLPVGDYRLDELLVYDASYRVTRLVARPGAEGPFLWRVIDGTRFERTKHAAPRFSVGR